jgi:hypothetical protein
VIHTQRCPVALRLLPKGSETGLPDGFPLTRSRPGEPKIDDRSLVHSARSRSISAILFEVRAGTRRNVGESALSEIPTLPLAQQGPPHRPAADALTPSTPATSSALPGGCRLPLPGVGCAHDDAKPVGATAASQRQVDQRHVAMSTGHQAREVKPDGVLAGATPGRHVQPCGSDRGVGRASIIPVLYPPFRTFEPSPGSARLPRKIRASVSKLRARVLAGLHGRKSGLRVVCGPRCRGTWLPTTPRAPPLPRCGLVHNNEDPVPDSSSSDRVEACALIFVNLSVNFTGS